MESSQKGIQLAGLKELYIENLREPLASVNKPEGNAGILNALIPIVLYSFFFFITLYALAKKMISNVPFVNPSFGTEFAAYFIVFTFVLIVLGFAQWGLLVVNGNKEIGYLAVFGKYGTLFVIPTAINLVALVLSFLSYGTSLGLLILGLFVFLYGASYFLQHADSVSSKLNSFYLVVVFQGIFLLLMYWVVSRIVINVASSLFSFF